MHEVDRGEHCPKCMSEAHRVWSNQSRIELLGTQVQHAEFNPAFGCIVKSKYHRSELAKKHGVVEIGNDFKSPQSLEKHFSKDRERKWKKSWDDA